MKRRHFLLGPAAGAASSYLGAATEAGVGDGDILLGQSCALSGPLGVLGTEFRDGALLCFDEVNQSGGVEGRAIRLISRDDGYVTDRATANTRQLVEEDNVFAIFGQFGTGITLASLPLTTARGIPLFAPVTGADALRASNNRYLFHVRASYAVEMRQIVDHLVTTGVRSIGIVFQGDPFGESGRDGALKALAAHRIEAAAVSPMRVAPTVDVESAVQGLSRQRPSAIILATSGKGAVGFIRRYTEVSAGCQFFGMSVISSRELAVELGDRSRGIAISQVVPSPWRVSVPIVRDYQRLASARKIVPSYGSLESFIAARALVEALRRCGRHVSRERLVAALEGFRDVDLGGFRLRYTEGRRGGSDFVEMSMLSRAGEFVR